MDQHSGKENIRVRKVFLFHDILAERVEGGDREMEKSCGQKFPDFTTAAPTLGSH